MPELLITSPYGVRNDPFTGERKGHNGIDIAIPQGTPLYSSAPGRVVKVWHDDPVNGGAVKIDHGNGLSTSYVHMSAVYVRAGDPVGWQTLLGLSGGEPGTYGAGRSTGAHLHYVVRRNGQSIDPVPAVAWARYGYTLRYR